MQYTHSHVRHTSLKLPLLCSSLSVARCENTKESGERTQTEKEVILRALTEACLSHSVEYQPNRDVPDL